MNDDLVLNLSRFIEAQLVELAVRSEISTRELRELYKQVRMHLDVVAEDLRTLRRLGER